MEKKYKELPAPRAFPRFDGPLFKNRRPFQDEFDSGLLTAALGMGGLFWVYLSKGTISFESLIGLGWGMGVLLGLLFFILKSHRA